MQTHVAYPDELLDVKKIEVFHENVSASELNNKAK